MVNSLAGCMVKSVALCPVVALAFLVTGALGGGTPAAAFSRAKPASGVEAAGGSAAPANSVWITRADGAQSCSPKSGQSLEEGAADLKQARVRVLDSHKGADGKLHMQMCGAPSGSTNAYLIPKDDLAQATALGFVTAK